MQSNFKNFLQQTYYFLSSKNLALVLFFVLVAVLIPKASLNKQIALLDSATRILLYLIGLNILLCTIRRFKTLPKPTLIIHIGSIVILAGGVMSSLGYVATVNIYEGASTGSFFRWDIEQDVSLGFDLAVDRINTVYYPVRVKIGVLKGQEKVNLFILKTGDSFNLDSFQITPVILDPKKKTVTLDVTEKGGQPLGSYITDGDSTLSQEFPYDFKLVAFQNPAIKRIWADLRVFKNAQLVTEGPSEVNHPFIWNGLRLYNTSINEDESGRPYAGIQIVRDPGIPYVYAGFGIFFLGSLMCLNRFFKKGLHFKILK